MDERLITIEDLTTSVFDKLRQVGHDILNMLSNDKGIEIEKICYAYDDHYSESAYVWLTIIARAKEINSFLFECNQTVKVKIFKADDGYYKIHIPIDIWLKLKEEKVETKWIEKKWLNFGERQFNEDGNKK